MSSRGSAVGGAGLASARRDDVCMASKPLPATCLPHIHVGVSSLQRHWSKGSSKFARRDGRKNFPAHYDRNAAADANLFRCPLELFRGDLAVAAKWKAEVVVCEGQYPCADVSTQSLLTLSYCAGMLLGALFATSGAKRGYVLKPKVWKDALAAGSSRIRKDIVLNRISRALLPSEYTTDRDILDAIGIGWGFCALGTLAEAHLKIQRGGKFKKSSKVKCL